MIKINEKEQNTNHDGGYKTILSIKENFLHFLNKYIEKPWTKNISLDDMEKIEKSFITPEFKHIDSDIIYKTRFNGSDMYFYVLLELQSTVDFTMPFRLLRYMVELLTDIFKNTDENERSRKNFKLPAIVPIVLYNGDDKWTAVTEYKKYTENYNIFGNNIINFEYLLFDLNRQDVEAVNSTRKLLDLIFRLDMLHISDNNLNKFPEAFMEYDSDLSTAEIAVLTNWLKYVLLKNKMSPELEKELKQALAKKEGNVMTHSFERFVDGKYNEGRQKGMQEGIQEGIQKGIQKIIEKLKQGGMSEQEIEKLLN